MSPLFREEVDSSTSTTLTGITAGETLVGIDARPANTAIYAVGSTGVAPSVVPGVTEFAYPIGELEHAQRLRARLDELPPEYRAASEVAPNCRE